MKLPTGAAGRMAAPRGNPKHAAKLVETPGDGLSDRSSILLTSTSQNQPHLSVRLFFCSHFAAVKTWQRPLPRKKELARTVLLGRGRAALKRVRSTGGGMTKPLSFQRRLCRKGAAVMSKRNARGARCKVPCPRAFVFVALASNCAGGKRASHSRNPAGTRDRTHP